MRAVVVDLAEFRRVQGQGSQHEDGTGAIGVGDGIPQSKPSELVRLIDETANLFRVRARRAIIQPVSLGPPSNNG